MVVPDSAEVVIRLSSIQRRVHQEICGDSNSIHRLLLLQLLHPYNLHHHHR
jgi:hypothetical protein